ncbi:DUF349 domain-containing protein [Ningiella sp. W23]|uniref:DUF349 domain-containing protein n=1 Tax=Ningiella sp. W23 TaxID=3023715 RepID=UPI003756A02E
MIFKRLFTPAHQHRDPEKRLQAIANIAGKASIDDHDRQVLHELAFNDESLAVNLAALEAINSFTLWLKAYENHMQASVKARAKRAVLSLVEDTIHVTDALFEDIVKQHHHNALVKEMLLTSARLQGNERLCVDTVLALFNENEVRQFYSKHANTPHRKMLIEGTHDDKQLRRFKKAENDSALNDIIDAKIKMLETQAALPLKVKSAAVLINSRLLALTELQCYASISEQKERLLKEFEALKQDFVCLSEDDSASITSKYFDIKERVDKRLSDLEADYLAKQHLEAISDTVSDIHQRAGTAFDQIDLLSLSESNEQLDGQLALLKNALCDLKLELNDVNLDLSTGAHRQQIKQLENDFDQYLSSLEDLPALIQRNQQLEALIQGIEMALEKSAEAQRSTSDEVAATISDIQSQAADILHQGVSNQIRQRWQSIISDYQKTRNAKRKVDKEHARKLEKRCFAKVNVSLKLIDQGKFKAAIATFHAAQHILEDIVAPSASLVRKFEDVKEKVAELKDWQSYIATPRKPELIAAVEKLLQEDEKLAQSTGEKAEQDRFAGIDIEQRVSTVKEYRRAFNSLGKLNTDEDDALNKSFDDALEKAFEPCRRHFEQQEKLRADNLRKGETLLEALKALESVEDPVLLAKHLQALSQQYYKLGELERSARTALHKSYQARYKPLQARVNAFYEQNAELKSKLVDKALALTRLESIDDAASQAKNLQQKWKDIGFAGKKHDAKLWRSFREANDKIFGCLHERQDAQKAQADEQFKACNTIINEAESIINDAADQSQLAQAQDRLKDASAQIATLPQAQQKRCDKQLDTAKRKLTAKQKAFEEQKHRQGMQTVFTLLEQVSTAQNADKPAIAPESLEGLSPQLRQAFLSMNRDSSASTMDKVAPKLLQDMDREKLTTVAQLLFHPEAFEVDSEAKKDVQLKLMAAKLEGEQMPDMQTMLACWIAKGPLSKGDAKLISLLQAIYMKND